MAQRRRPEKQKRTKKKKKKLREEVSRSSPEEEKFREDLAERSVRILRLEYLGEDSENRWLKCSRAVKLLRENVFERRRGSQSSFQSLHIRSCSLWVGSELLKILQVSVSLSTFSSAAAAARICNVSTRWGHAHPTWTFWALPFLGTWSPGLADNRGSWWSYPLPNIAVGHPWKVRGFSLHASSHRMCSDFPSHVTRGFSKYAPRIRRHLRDETLPASAKVPALRVTDIDVDEDLLNIGTWEERGHKPLGFDEMRCWGPEGAEEHWPADSPIWRNSWHFSIRPVLHRHIHIIQ